MLFGLSTNVSFYSNDSWVLTSLTQQHLLAVVATSFLRLGLLELGSSLFCVEVVMASMVTVLSLEPSGFRAALGFLEVGAGEAGSLCHGHRQLSKSWRGERQRIRETGGASMVHPTER